MNNNLIEGVIDLLYEGRTIPVTILPNVMEYVHTFEDGSSTESLALRSVGKKGLLGLNLHDPENLYNITVIEEPSRFSELIPYRESNGWVLKKEWYINDIIIVVESLNCVELTNHEK